MTNEEIFNKNINIAYKLVQQYRNCGIEYEDLEQICLTGLWEAIITFKEEKGYALSTYAYRVIQNKVNMCLRTTRRIKNNISIHTEIGNNITIEDIIKDDSDYIERIENKEELQQLYEVLNKELESFKSIEKDICLLMLNGKKQSEIAKRVKLSQSYVSRLEIKIKNKFEKVRR